MVWELDRFGSTTQDQLVAFPIFWLISYQLKGTAMVVQSPIMMLLNISTTS